MIGIICAMESETRAVCDIMDKVEEKNLHHIKVYTGMIETKDIVVAQCGVGKVNAAVSSALLLSEYDIELMINVGVAGGLSASQKVLDVVVGTNVIQHDVDTSALDGEEGIGLRYECDENYSNQFIECLKQENVNVWHGAIASGDVFVDKDHGLTRIMNLFPECLCAEMEAGAISQTCHLFNVPCVIVRSLSDVAHNENSAMDFPVFEVKASHSAAKACHMFITRL